MASDSKITSTLSAQAGVRGRRIPAGQPPPSGRVCGRSSDPESPKPWRVRADLPPPERSDRPSPSGSPSARRVTRTYAHGSLDLSARDDFRDACACRGIAAMFPLMQKWDDASPGPHLLPRRRVEPVPGQQEPCARRRPNRRHRLPAHPREPPRTRYPHLGAARHPTPEPGTPGGTHRRPPAGHHPGWRPPQRLPRTGTGRRPGAAHHLGPG